jgi:hypothetical protein
MGWPQPGDVQLLRPPQHPGLQRKSRAKFVAYADGIAKVGYHNEHHDFPSVPWTRLPALRALAPEFYDIIPSHPSWPMVIVNFIRDKDVGIFARAKRIEKNNKAKHENSSSDRE